MVPGPHKVLINNKEFEVYDLKVTPCKPIGRVDTVVTSVEAHGTITFAPGDMNRLLLGLTPSTRYWERRRAHRRGKSRRLLEPQLGRAWRRFRRNFMPWVLS